MKITKPKFLLSYMLIIASLFLLTGCCNKNKLIDKTWVLEKYGPATELKGVLTEAEITPPAKSEITLTLSDTSRFSGNDGCNLIFGDYTTGSWCRINFGNINSTLMYCQDSLVRKQAGAYSTIIRNVNKFRVTDNKLKLKTPDNELLLYRKQ